MELNIFDKIRESCKAVAKQSEYVHIDHSRLACYAKALQLERIKKQQIDPDCHYLDHEGATAAFFITLDAVNFGSGYFPHLKKKPGLSGYFTIASSLNNYYKANGPINTEKLAEIRPEDCVKIFGQSPDNKPICELMELFAKAWNDLGFYLTKHFNGSFTGMIESAKASAETLLKSLIQMPYFNDVESYKGMDVHFYKRAQLLAADLSIAFGGQGLGEFDDLRHLTIFADNLVPHVLRIDQILIYERSLADRIDSEILIPAGSQEEVEIRACALHAVELIVHELFNFGWDIKAMDIDYLLWNRGQKPEYKKIKPRHRTRTVFY